MTVTIDELRNMYENNSNEYVCEKLNISQPTLLRYLNEAGIPLKGKGGGMVSAPGEKKIKIINKDN